MDGLSSIFTYVHYLWIKSSLPNGLEQQKSSHFWKKPMVLAPRLSLDGDVELGLEGREGFEGGLKQYNKDIIFTGLV